MDIKLDNYLNILNEIRNEQIIKFEIYAAHVNHLIREEAIIRWRDKHQLEFLQCACKFTAENHDVSDEENKSKRLEIK